MALTITNDIHNNPYKIYAWRDNNLRFIASQYEGTNTTSIDEAIAGSSSTTITSAKTIWFRLYDERGELLNLDSYSSIDLFFRLPNGDAMYSCDIYTEDDVDYVRFVLRNGITQTAGEVYGELVLTTTTGTVKFYGINFLIKDATSDSAGSDAPLYGTMVSALQRIGELEGSTTDPGLVLMDLIPFLTTETNPIPGVQVYDYMRSALQFEFGRMLPDGYQQVQYITNVNKDYIDLGVTGGNNIKTVLIGCSASGGNLFGAMGANSTAPEYRISSRSSYYSIGYHGTASHVKQTGILYSDFDGVPVIFVIKGNEYRVDDNVNNEIGTINSSDPGSFTTQNLYVFATNGATGSDGTLDITGPVGERIYGIVLFSESNSLYRCFIPCIDIETGTAGLYDTVIGTFRTAYTDTDNIQAYGLVGPIKEGTVNSEFLADGSITDAKLANTYLSSDYIDVEALTSTANHVPQSSLVERLLTSKADASDVPTSAQMAAWDAKAEPSDIPSITSTTVTLSSSGWSSSRQTVTVSGVTTSNIVYCSPAPASIQNAASAQIYCSTQSANSLTFMYLGTAPTSNITMNVVVIG